MSLSTEELKDIGRIYFNIYGSDIRVDLNSSNGNSFNLEIKNGDYDVVGAVPGNKFHDVNNLITQRFLTILFTSFDPNNPNGSSKFLDYVKNSRYFTREQKKNLIKAEIILTASKIPQIIRIVNLYISDNSDSPTKIVIDVGFEIVTGEIINIPLAGDIQ